MKKQTNKYEVDFLGTKVKTIEYVLDKLPGRFDDRKITPKTLYRYLARGLPHFEWCGRILFSDEDLASIPGWIARNCRGGRNKRMSL